MTLPLLLLGLYSGLLAISLALSSWVGHAIPPPDAARRVTNAAERAVLLHLAGPFRLVMGAVVLMGAVGVAGSALLSGPLLAFALGPLLGTALVLSAVYFSCRKLLRTSAQVVGATEVDAHVSLCSRSLLAAVLCSESSLSLTLLGAFSLISRDHGSDVALRLVVLMAASIAVSAAVFARGSAGALLSSSQGDSTPGPHPGSLASLVALSFHAPGLRLLSFLIFSALGHCVLLVLSDGTDTQQLWLYPHLLKLLGLFALGFGSISVRSSESETSNAAWLRGGLVCLALLIASAWSLSTELPDRWARPVPAGLTFFFFATVVFLWVNDSSPLRDTGGFLAFGQLRRIPAALALLILSLVLVVAVGLLPEEVGLPHSALLRLLVAAALAAAPLPVVWSMARDLNGSFRHVRELSYLGETGRDGAPSARFVGLFPLLALIASASALGGILLIPEESSHILLCTLGSVCGALTLWALLGLIERSSEPSMKAIGQLLGQHLRQRNAPQKLNLEAAIDSCRQAAAGGVVWLLVALFPALLTWLLHFFLPLTELQPLTLGWALGGLLLGLGLDWANCAARHPQKRTLGVLSHVTGLSQALLLIAVGLHLT